MRETKRLVFDTLRFIRSLFIRVLLPKKGYFLFPAPARNTRPISLIQYGFDRGMPVDRYYIEKFMEQNKALIKGTVLEITDNKYTKQFGGDKVAKSDALDIDPTNDMANIHGDLRNLTEIADNTYDCLIITQTYVMIDDYEAAIRESLRVLKSGGVLLATMPCLSPVYNIKYHHWRFTDASAKYVFGKYVKSENLTVQTYGNALAGQGFWVGMAVQDFEPGELDYSDPLFPVIVTIKAVKS